MFVNIQQLTLIYTAITNHMFLHCLRLAWVDELVLLVFQVWLGERVLPIVQAWEGELGMEEDLIVLEKKSYVHRQFELVVVEVVS